MEILLRILLLIAGACFFVFIITLIFSLFLIIWPFLAVGVLASIAYTWLSRYRPNNSTKNNTEQIIIIEHEKSEKN